jgi:hypothetical protein
LIGIDKIVKENSSTLNIENKSSVNGKLKMVLPLMLIFGFVFLVFFRRFYKNQKALSALND